MQLLPPRFPPPLFPISHTPPLFINLLTHKHMYTKRKIHLNTLTHTLCSHLSTHSLSLSLSLFLPLSLFLSLSLFFSPSLFLWGGTLPLPPIVRLPKLILAMKSNVASSLAVLYLDKCFSLSLSVPLSNSLTLSSTHTHTNCHLSLSLSFSSSPTHDGNKFQLTNRQNHFLLIQFACAHTHTHTHAHTRAHKGAHILTQGHTPTGTYTLFFISFMHSLTNARQQFPIQLRRHDNLMKHSLRIILFTKTNPECYRA